MTPSTIYTVCLLFWSVTCCQMYQYAVALFLFLLVTFRLFGVDLITPHVGGVEQRKKPQSTFYVSVKPWLHSDMHIYGFLPFWTLRVLKNLILGATLNFSKSNRASWTSVSLRDIKGLFEGIGVSGLQGLENSSLSNTVMKSITTFWSTMDHLYNSGTVRL